jgi:hypothetical protein
MLTMTVSDKMNSLYTTLLSHLTINEANWAFDASPDNLYVSIHVDIKINGVLS